MEKQIQIDCPAEILLALHTTPEGFAEWVKSQTAVALFKEGKISSGMGARWLGIPRTTFLLNAMEAGAELLEDSADDFARETSLL